MMFLCGLDHNELESWDSGESALRSSVVERLATSVVLGPH